MVLERGVQRCFGAVAGRGPRFDGTAFGLAGCIFELGHIK